MTALPICDLIHIHREEGNKHTYREERKERKDG
jgi:hypothetical protein